MEQVVVILRGSRKGGRMVVREGSSHVSFVGVVD